MQFSKQYQINRFVIFDCNNVISIAFESMLLYVYKVNM